MTGPTSAPGAHHEETGEQFEWLHQAVRCFAEELDEALSSLSGNVSAAELQERLQGQKMLLDVLPPLNLVTVGATKAGKSTLVNAMLSRRGWHSKDDFYEILPRRLLAETNAFWRVMTSRISKFEFEYEKDHQFFDSFQGLASFIQTNYSRGSVKNNALVTLRVPAMFTSVCGGDFVLIDSPGLSEARFPHFVHEFLQDNPHILIYVIPITAGCLTTIDDNFLSEIFKSSRIQRSSTCVFVLSCYDRALGETDREEVDRSVAELQHRIEEMFAAKAFPTSCLVLQRGCFNPAWSEVQALRQMDDLLRFIEREFLRNSRVVVLKSIFAATQDLGYDAYNACLSNYKVQYKGIQTQRMFSLFEKLEALKGSMLDLFRSCLEDILQPPPQSSSKISFSNSKAHKPLDQPASNLREHVELQVAKLYAAVGKRSAIEGFTAMFKKDFWDKNSFQNHLLEQLRPSIKSYIVCAVEDALKSVCVSFLQLCRSEILENAQANLDAETFQELANSLCSLAAKSSGTAAGNLAQLLGTQNVALMGIATQAVDKLASQATSRALFMVTKFNPIWNRSTAAQRVAVAVADQLGAASSHFFTETRDIALRLLEDITRAVKVGTQDYYRTINAETVLQRHPQLKVVHLLLEGTHEISRRMSRLEAILSADVDAEFEDQEEAERRRTAEEAEGQRRLQREAAKKAADLLAQEHRAAEEEAEKQQRADRVAEEVRETRRTPVPTTSLAKEEAAQQHVPAQRPTPVTVPAPLLPSEPRQPKPSPRPVPSSPLPTRGTPPPYSPSLTASSDQAASPTTPSVSGVSPLRDTSSRPPAVSDGSRESSPSASPHPTSGEEPQASSDGLSPEAARQAAEEAQRAALAALEAAALANDDDDDGGERESTGASGQ